MPEESTRPDTMPHAPHAEAAALCCIIEHPKRFTPQAWEAQLDAGHFYLPRHSALWTLVSQRTKDGKSVDPVSLREAIRDQKPAGLSVSCFSDILLTEFDDKAWHGYVETLRDRYTRRIAVQAGQSIIDDNLDGAAALNAIRRASELASSVFSGSTAVKDAKTAIGAFIATLEERRENGKMPGLSTGIDELDHHTGGLRNGELWVIGAKTSMGKSALMLQMAWHALSNGKRVAIFTLEMGADEVIGRLLSCGEGVPIGQILNPQTLATFSLKKIKASLENLKKTGLMVCDNSDQTIDFISGHCQRISDTGKLDLIVIDYLQLVTAPRIKGQNREQEVAGISRACKQLAKRIKCPVITATQLNEQGQARESRAIEQDADTVILVHPPAKDQTDITVQFWKCRNAARGVSLNAKFDGAHQKFTFT
jgi:replicative DNA helicase